MIDPISALAIGGAIGNIGGGLIGQAGSQQANEMGVASAREQMAFQMRMRDSQHQAAVEDLQKAGLNPILAAGGGNAAPSGAMMSPTNPGLAMQEGIKGAANSAQWAATTGLQAKTAESNIALNQATQKLTETKETTEQANAKTAAIEQKAAGLNLEVQKASQDALKKVGGVRPYINTAADAINTLNGAKSLITPRIKIGNSPNTDGIYNNSERELIKDYRKWRK